MITRIVKMEIKPGSIQTFMEYFSSHAIHMQEVQGCASLQLVHSIDDENIFFTISEWHRAEDLQSYRHSDLFKKIWSAVKPLFCAPAQAWSTESLYHGKN